MTENLQETVKKLYALRAGLSLASEKMDIVREKKSELRAKVKEKEEAIESKEKNIDENQRNCMRIRKSYADKNEDIEYSKKRLVEINEKLEKIEEKEKEAEKYSKLYKILRKIMIVSITVGIIMLLVSCNPNMKFLDKPEENYILWFLYCAVFGACVLGAGISPIVMNKIEYKRYVFYWDSDDSKSDLERWKTQHLLTIEQKITDENDVLNDENYKNSVSIIENENAQIEELNAEIGKAEQIAKGEIIVCSKEGEEIYKSLIPVFSPILDVRDWENVDLLIFMFETGRAKTMQEALQQVDLYRHTDRIVNAIRDASVVIASSISSAISRVERTIQQSAVMINSHLGEIRKNQSYIENELVSSNERLAGLIDASSMQRALLEKANISSDRLVGQIDHMCMLADEAYFMNHKKWYA